MGIIVVELALLDQLALPESVLFLVAVSHSALAFPVPVDEETAVAVRLLPYSCTVCVGFFVEDGLWVLGVVHSCHAVGVPFLHQPPQPSFLELGGVLLFDVLQGQRICSSEFDRVPFKFEFAVSPHRIFR